MTKNAALIIFGALAVSCGAAATSTDGDPALGTGQYELRVTHEFNRVLSEIPMSSELEARHFAPVEDGRVYIVELSEDGRRVEVGPAEAIDSIVVVAGVLWPDGPAAANVRPLDHSFYALDEGVFAGGHLLIWSEAEGLRAELTIYGSGLPIVSAERGDLIPM